MEVVMHPIGIIHSPFTDRDQTPIQTSRSQAVGLVEIYPEFAGGFQDTDGFSHIILLYAFHRVAGYSLRVKPFLDDQEPGLFAIRHPQRPNPIGLSIVKLRFHKANTLTIEGVDALAETPLLDIKPYVHEFDLKTETREGWYETRSKK